MIPRSIVDSEVAKLQKAMNAPEPLKYTEVEVEDYTFTFATGSAYVVTLFPDDGIEEFDGLFLVSKPIETVSVYKTPSLLMVSRLKRVQKMYEKPFMPSIQGVGDQPAS